MPVLLAILSLFLMQVAGEALVRFSGLPLPGPLVGMLFMLFGLIALGRVPEGLRLTTQHLLRHLMLLFVPSVAGIIAYFGSLQREWLPFIAACVGSAALTLVVTMLVFQWMLKRGGPKAGT
jgi:holin-like protein